MASEVKPLDPNVQNVDPMRNTELTEVDQFLLSLEPEKEPEVPTETKESPPAEPKREQVVKEPEVVATPSDQKLDRVVDAVNKLVETQRQPDAPRREPEVEYEDVLGVPLPKDPTRRPVNVTPEQLIQMGWNEDPTKALNTLLNVVLGHVIRTYVPLTVAQVRAERESESGKLSQKQAFETDYPDLAEQSEIVQLAESAMWREGDPRQQFKSMDEYRKGLATNARTRIARIRGQSLEEYEKSVGKKSEPTRKESRAVSTATTSKLSRPSVSLTDQEREINELL